MKTEPPPTAPPGPPCHRPRTPTKPRHPPVHWPLTWKRRPKQSSTTNSRRLLSQQRRRPYMACAFRTCRPRTTTRTEPQHTMVPPPSWCREPSNLNRRWATDDAADGPATGTAAPSIKTVSPFAVCRRRITARTEPSQKPSLCSTMRGPMRGEPWPLDKDGAHAPRASSGADLTTHRGGADALARPPCGGNCVIPGHKQSTAARAASTPMAKNTTRGTSTTPTLDRARQNGHTTSSRPSSARHRPTTRTPTPRAAAWPAPTF